MSGYLPQDSYRKVPGTGRYMGGHPINSGCQLCMVNNESIGTVSHDLTRGANNGTINNGSWGPGKFGNTVRYNGSSTYIQIADVAALRLNNFSLSCWFKTSSTPDGFLIQKSAGGNDKRNYEMDLLGAGAKLRLYFSAGEGQYKGFTGNSVIAPRVWYHAVGTFDGATSTLYLNAQFDGSSAQAFTPDTGTNPVQIGRYLNGENGLPGNYFAGLMDLQRIWNRALYAYEVRQLFERPFIGIEGISGHSAMQFPGWNSTAAGTTFIPIIGHGPGMSLAHVGGGLAGRAHA